MKLIDLLVKELPKRGGWPANSNFVVQDSDKDLKAGVNPRVNFESDGIWRKNDLYSYEHVWGKDEFYNIIIRLPSLSDDHGTAIVTREQYEAALQQPVWNGEGLPPVSCECEFQNFSDSPWTQVRVIHYNGDEVWLEPLNGAQSFVLGNPEGFRPIRTEADRKRDEFAKQIADKSVVGEHWQMQCVGRAIYDAIASGKIPGVKLE